MPSSSSLAPVALFSYVRPDHLRRTLDALRVCPEAKDTDLVVFSDGPKNEKAQAGVDAVRSLLRTVSGFRSVRVVERATNMGLANSIIQGVGEVVAEYGRVIVMEDDLVASPVFLTYMNRGLDLYEDDDNVAAVHGYCFPGEADLPETYFLRAAGCWGWATWARGWAHFRSDGVQLLREMEERQLCHSFDVDGAYPFTQMLRDQILGKNNSWAVRWGASLFLKGKVVLNPGKSMCKNIGFDGTGEHCGDSKIKSPQMATDISRMEKVHSVELPDIRAEFGRRMRNMVEPRREEIQREAWITVVKVGAKKAVKKIAHQFGLDIVRYREPKTIASSDSLRSRPSPMNFPSGTAVADQEILGKTAEFAMDTLEHQLALIASVRYVVRRGIPGCFVECGGWRGGNAVTIAMALAQEGVMDRDVYLFDRFEGAGPPDDAGQSSSGVLAVEAAHRGGPPLVRRVSSFEDVRANMSRVGYPMERIHLIKGSVEQTLPRCMPSSPISLLCVDSEEGRDVMHEMKQLFPALEKDGVLIIDDCGHWQGVRKAIDEHLQKEAKRYLLHSIDRTSRILVKN